MAQTTIYWDWEDAFSKFGFWDGDGPNFTHLVVDFLHGLGYKDIEPHPWGIHNYMIHELVKDDARYNSGLKVIEFDGYENPRVTLPKKLVAKLDKKFSGDVEWFE